MVNDRGQHALWPDIAPAAPGSGGGGEAAARGEGGAARFVRDAQWDSPFLCSLGAEPMPRERYLVLLAGPAERIALPSGSRPARLLIAPEPA